MQPCCEAFKALRSDYYIISTRISARYAGLILAPAEGLWPSATYGALRAPFLFGGALRAHFRGTLQVPFRGALWAPFKGPFIELEFVVCF